MKAKSLRIFCACVLAVLLMGLFGCTANQPPQANVPETDVVTDQTPPAAPETDAAPQTEQTPDAPVEATAPPEQESPQEEPAPEPLSAMDEALMQLRLLENEQPVWEEYFDLNGIAEVTLDDLAAHYGAPVSIDAFEAYPDLYYQIVTYADGSQAGGWQREDGSMVRVGALYLLPCDDLLVSGVAFGENWLDVVQRFCLTAPEKTALFYGEPAILLYGEIIHMGTYGYVEYKDDAPYCVEYGHDGIIVRFFLEGGCVSAVRYHREEETRLPKYAEVAPDRN